MKWLWVVLLKFSSVAAERLYGEKVTQVDIWLGEGRKIMVMSADEAGKLKHITKEISKNWTEEERSKLARAIADIRHRSGGENG